jgi:hypothetical protein
MPKDCAILDMTTTNDLYQQFWVTQRAMQLTLQTSLRPEDAYLTAEGEFEQQVRDE